MISFKRTLPSGGFHVFHFVVSLIESSFNLKFLWLLARHSLNGAVRFGVCIFKITRGDKYFIGHVPHFTIP